MFDLRTHVRDPKTGRVVTKQPYRLHIIGGEKLFERDGRFFYENGEEVQTKVSAKTPNVANAQGAQK